jgi:amino acid adenylation domain-containing protein
VTGWSRGSPLPPPSAQCDDQFVVGDVVAGVSVAPVRVSLLTSGPQLTHLVFVVHHITCDGWSIGLLASDLSTAYRARSVGSAPDWAPLPVQYADYAIWQQTLLGSEQQPSDLAAEQIQYWTASLTGSPELINLPLDRPRPPVASYRGRTTELIISPALHGELVELAREQGCTMFMVLHAALAAVLSAYGAGQDIVLGTAFAGRNNHALEPVVGFFIDTLVLRTDFSGDPTFGELLERVRDTDLDAYSHQDVPFERVVHALKPERSSAYHPLFQVFFTYDDGIAADQLRLPGLATTRLPEPVNTAKFDLSVDFIHQHPETGRPAGMQAIFEYATDLFDPETVERLGQRLLRFLTAVTIDPDEPISRISLLTGAERRLQLEEWNGPVQIEPPLDLLARIRQIAEERPQAIAVSGQADEISYNELVGMAAKIAEDLVAAGAEPDTLVAVLSHRTPRYVTAVLGVLGAGCGFMPVDVDTSVSRAAQMLEDGQVGLLMVEADLLDRAESIAAATAHPVRVLLPGSGHADPSALALRGYWDELAYAVFTSGSTGRLKGVLVPHRGLANHLRAVIDLYKLDEQDALVFNAPLTFDVSVWQALTLLAVGGRVHTVDDELARDPVALAETCANRGVTLLQIVPSLLRVLLDACDAYPRLVDRISGLRLMLAHGEELPPDLVARWDRRVPGVPLVNVYGPAECSDDVSIAMLDPDQVGRCGRVTIGRPLINTFVFVLDDQLRLVPAGVTGELYVSGAGLARGYAGRAALTAERFIANPFGLPGERMYRTGDLARWNSSGELEFLGRADGQVKVRGFRIEPAEIEHHLQAVPGVDQVAAIVREDRPGDRRLVAYYTPDGQVPLDDHRGLKAAAEQSMPNYMVPSAFIELDAMPLTGNGKLDRRALPAPEYTGGAGREPSTAAEHQVRAMFSEVLGVNEVTADDDFFELGGHSLLATRLLNRIRVVMGAEASIRDLFDAPTVAGLADTLVTRTRSFRPVLRRRTSQRDLLIPLSYPQRGLWFLNQLSPADTSYHVRLTWRFSGELDDVALHRALRDVVLRHGSLRTVFPEIDGQPEQRVRALAELGPLLRCTDITDEEVAAAEEQTVARAFNLGQDIPLRAELLRTRPHEGLLILVVHHVAFDGWSESIFCRDLSLAYAARAAGGAPEWPELLVHYTDYAHWQHELLGAQEDPDSLLARQLTYWQNRLNGMPQEAGLAAGHRTAPSGLSRTSTFRIDAANHLGMTALAQRTGTTLFMVVHAALAAAITELGSETDLPLGTVVSGRSDEALNQLVGYFTNTVVLRTDTSGNPTFTELLRRVREVDLAAFTNQDIPFEKVVAALNPSRKRVGSPLFQIMFSLAERAVPMLAVDGVYFEYQQRDNTTAKFDLEVLFEEEFSSAGEPRGIAGFIEYRTDKFDVDLVDSLAVAVVRMLDAVIPDPDIRIEAIFDRAGATDRQAVVVVNKSERAGNA